MHQETLEDAVRKLVKVRGMLGSARESLESGPDDPRLRELIARLERMTAEIEHAEQTCARAVLTAGLQ